MVSTEAPSYTVTHSGNGNTGGAIPADANSRKRSAKVILHAKWLPILDSSFNPNVPVDWITSYVNSIAIESDGKILIGGNFTSYHGTAIMGIARINP
jgi:hypothetical protein